MATHRQERAYQIDTTISCGTSHYADTSEPPHVPIVRAIHKRPDAYLRDKTRESLDAWIKAEEEAWTATKAGIRSLPETRLAKIADAARSKCRINRRANSARSRVRRG